MTDVEDAIDRLVGAEATGEFLERAIIALDSAIPSSSVVFTAYSLVDGTTRGLTYPPERIAEYAPLMHLWERHVDDHPILSDPNMPIGVALRWSDVCDVERFYRTDLHRNFFAPLGLWHQLCVRVPSPPTSIVGFALNRGDDPFTDDDVAACSRLAPYLALASSADEGGSAVDGLDEALKGDGWTTVLITDDGGVVGLAGAQGLGVYVGAMLPEPLLHWFRGTLDRPSGRTVGAPIDARLGADDVDRPVEVRLVPSAGDAHVMVMRPATSTHDATLPAALTTRQREVLAELARGGTNRQIARRLGIAEETVKKHLSAAYRILEVGDRASALAALGGPAAGTADGRG